MSPLTRPWSSCQTPTVSASASRLDGGPKWDSLTNVCSFQPLCWVNISNTMWTKAIFRTSSHSHPPVRLTLWYTFHKIDFILSVVILYYDYFLTFDDEVRFFWGRKWSSITFLFFFNRYFPLAGHIPGVVKVLGSWSVNVSKPWVTLIAYSDWHLTNLSVP